MSSAKPWETPAVMRCAGFRIPYAPPKQYQANTYFFKGGFAVKVLL